LCPSSDWGGAGILHPSDLRLLSTGEIEFPTGERVSGRYRMGRNGARFGALPRLAHGLKAHAKLKHSASSTPSPPDHHIRPWQNQSGYFSMAYRNKVFVSFDGDNDMNYYRLMTAWKQHDNMTFNFANAHDLNYARDTSLEESIKAQLRFRLQNSKVFVLLIGASTRYLRKFVLWEIEQALSLALPIIGVNINGLRQQDAERTPALLRDKLAIYISFNAKILEHTLENWPVTCAQLRQQGKTGPYYYNEVTYRALGL
jgi:MTH538 TIR-like domain (DUF1863)